MGTKSLVIDMKKFDKFPKKIQKLLEQACVWGYGLPNQLKKLPSLKFGMSEDVKKYGSDMKSRIPLNRPEAKKKEINGNGTSCQIVCSCCSS